MKQNYLKELMTALLLLCCTAASAQVFEVDGIYYNILPEEDKTVEVTSGSNKYTGAVTIPASVTYNSTTYGVIGIGDVAFAYCSGLTSVEIPSSVTSIGSSAFYDCDGLTSIEIPSSVTSIGERAFYDCTSLTSIEIPASVTSIGKRAFYDCPSLTSIEIPSSVTSIGERAFYYCYGLTSIVVDEGNSVYDSRGNCNAIIETASNTLIAGCVNTIIPEGVTSIGESAFEGCSILTIEIPSSVTSISEGAFWSCYSLTSINIPAGVTSIGYGAFRGCTGLTSIVVDEGNSVYDSRGNCNAIIETASNTLILGCKNTIIPASVTSIGECAFRGCSSLTSIVIPAGVTSIGVSAFYYCYGLTSITSHIAAEDLFVPGNDAFRVIDKNACTLYVPAGAKSTYAATDGWKEFTNIVEFNGKCGDDVYWSFNEETGALTIFGTGAMYDYVNNDANRAPWYSNKENISTVSIGSGITVIGEWALAECLFTSIEFPNTLTTIKEEAFSDCSALTSITIPASVTSIEDYVFGCKSLETIVVEAGNTVYDSRNNCNAIMETSTNKLVAGSSNTVIPEETVSIGHYAFENRALTSIEIPANVTSIGNYAFLNTKLANIVIPNTVNYLGVGVFQNCDNLVSAKLPDNLTYINKDLFYQCTSLTDIEIPETVTNIAYAAFYLCPFTDINIPESVTKIGEYAFAGCWNLNKIAIPASVTRIDDRAFSGCTGLTSITSHITAENLFAPGNGAFYNVDKTNCTLYVPAGAKSTYATTQQWKDFTNIVETYDLTVTAAGYATMYLDKAVEIPAGVEAYTAARIEGDHLKMQAVEDVIPANTAVIIKAEEGNYSFAYSDETPDAIEGNLLRGTLTDTYIKPASAQTAYVLSKVDGVVGMYKAKLKADGTFKNNANRVYMLLGDINVGEGDLDTSSPGGQLSNGYRFDFSGTTAIESVETESAAPAVYYDLSGRRVENPEKGIYIVNGRKVFIK